MKILCTAGAHFSTLRWRLTAECPPSAGNFSISDRHALCSVRRQTAVQNFLCCSHTKDGSFCCLPSGSMKYVHGGLCRKDAGTLYASSARPGLPAGSARPGGSIRLQMVSGFLREETAFQKQGNQGKNQFFHICSSTLKGERVPEKGLPAALNRQCGGRLSFSAPFISDPAFQGNRKKKNTR